MKCYLPIFLAFLPISLLGNCPEFHAAGCSTQSIELGGFVQLGYQYTDVNDRSGVGDPNPYNNFLMKFIRLELSTDLGNDWTAALGLEFAGGPGDTCLCKDHEPFSVDMAFIEKESDFGVLRMGLDTVFLSEEERLDDSAIKPTHRSTVSNFFTGLGAQDLGGDHVGIYFESQCLSVHYSLGIANGYQGICMSSEATNNRLAYYGSLSLQSKTNCYSYHLGINAGYAPKGNSVNEINHVAFALNPFILGTWGNWSLHSEFFYGYAENANMTVDSANSCPWGFTIQPSVRFLSCLEFVARYAYLNSDQMGMTIDGTFGCAPSNTSLVSCCTLFDEAFSWYAGLNYYLFNDQTKISLGMSASSTNAAL